MATIYRKGSQKPLIEEEQTTQWPKDTKGVVRRPKGQTKTKKTLDSKLKIEQQEPHLNTGMNSCAPEWLAVPVCYKTLGVLHIVKSSKSIVGDRGKKKQSR
jgi:hypothetical protein